MLDKTAVITGCSTGIGRATANLLVGAGYRVFGSVRRIADAQMLVEAFGARFVPLIFDLNDAAAIGRAAQEVGSHTPVCWPASPSLEP